MNKRSTFAESLRRFVEGKGFYAVVVVCVAAIGISGFYLLRSMEAGPGDDAPVSGTASVVVSTSPSLSPSPSPSAPSVPSPSAAPSPSPSQPSQSPAPSVSDGPKVEMPASPSPAPSPSPSPSASRPVSLVYTWPVKGELLADFSLETLAYDVTMGDWRTHSGIDIAAAQGTTVLATADGTVREIFADDLMGTTVVIDHGDGIVSTYSNLQTVPTVEVGDQVHTGSVIGAVGSTAIAESGRASHLHFELSKDGAAVDPEGYLPQQR